MAIQQLLREWPPGYGGVERVAHELSLCWGGVTYSLDVQGQACSRHDALPVSYRRKRLRSVGVGGRLHVPLPSRSLIFLLASSEPLHGHLPSPGVLLVLVLVQFCSVSGQYAQVLAENLAFPLCSPLCWWSDFHYTSFGMDGWRLTAINTELRLSVVKVHRQ